MSTENKDDLVTVFDERIRRISREIAQEVFGEARQPLDLSVKDIDAANIQKALQRIMIKEFISIREAHLLLGCSDGHIRNLVDKARRKQTSPPIPFLPFSGVPFFQRLNF